MVVGSEQEQDGEKVRRIESERTEIGGRGSELRDDWMDG